ncbi:MAG: hypothetical protein OXE44_10340 [Nitrospinae bacterium]|nr:hypothetical protein [Nitrospinota bacterium]
MNAPRKPTILKKFDKLPVEIQGYFAHFPALARGFPWEVSISYTFSLVETAHNMTVYCGVVKLHKVDSSLARTALENHHMTRPGFRDLYKTIFNRKLPQTIVDKIIRAEAVRDRILHGKEANDKNKRQAIVDVLDYAVAFNGEVDKVASFKPFGSLQGFKGRGKPLDKSTSRWILKGMGLLG